MKLPHFAIRNRNPVLLLLFLCIAMGTSAYKNLPREAAPDIQVPLLIVTVVYPGASPEDVESLVTKELEEDLQNVENLKEMSSVSSENAATITLEFELGFDVQEARIKTREILNQIKNELPDEVEEPIITEINLSEEPMLIVVLSGKVGLEKLKQAAESLQDDIEAIPGILDVELTGGLERQVNVQVNTDKLRHHRISLNTLADVVSRENANLPGGSLETGPLRYQIRIPSQYKSPEEINDVVVAAPEGSPIYVRDLAQVTFSYKDENSRSRFNSKESVSLRVVKRSGENLLHIRSQIRALVGARNQAWGGEIYAASIADTSKFVKRFVKDLENNIASGFLLVLIVLLVSMGIRNAFMVAAAIPLSFLIALIVLQTLGYTLNFVVLFSLILALGMLVDNAIVVIENIYRHMEEGKDKLQAALDGVAEVGWPIITSTLTTLLAFAPLIFMPGIVGEFLSYLPRTLIFALSASLVVGLMINPVIASMVMKLPGGKKSAISTVQLGDLRKAKWKGHYARVLEYALAHRKRVMLGAVGCFVGVMVLFVVVNLSRNGVEFFPVTEPDSATIAITAPPGSNLNVSDAYATQAEGAVQNYQSSIDTVVTDIGGSTRQDSGPHLSRLSVSFPEWVDWDLRPLEVIAKLRVALKKIVGAEVHFSLAQAGPPTGAPVNIEVAGEDFEAILPLIATIKQRIQNIPGLVNLDDDFERNRTELQVRVDRDKLAKLGFNAQQVGLAVRTAFNGRTVSTYREGKEEYDINVRLSDAFRATPDDLARFYLVGSGGAQIPLSEVATVDTAPSFGSIRHKGLDRVITVSADAQGVAGPRLLNQVQAALSDLEFPPGVSLRYTGENEDQQESQSFLGQSFLVALCLIFIVLVAQFNSFTTPLIILSSVILSLIGVFMGLILHDRPFSIMMGGIGVISLAGVVVNNAIVLLDFTNRLRKRGYARNEAVVLAGMARLRPVLMTAITTILGLLPVALGVEINFFGWPILRFGSESGVFWTPMALAVIYGLSVATVLTLVVVPVLYTLVDDLGHYGPRKLTDLNTKWISLLGRVQGSPLWQGSKNRLRAGMPQKVAAPSQKVGHKTGATADKKMP